MKSVNNDLKGLPSPPPPPGPFARLNAGAAAQKKSSTFGIPPPPVPPPPGPPSSDGQDVSWDSLESEWDSHKTGAQEKETPAQSAKEKTSVAATPTGKARQPNMSGSFRKRRASRAGYGRVVVATLDDVAKASMVNSRPNNRLFSTTLNSSSVKEVQSPTADTGSKSLQSAGRAQRTGRTAAGTRQSAADGNSNTFWLHHPALGYIAAKQQEDGNFESLERGGEIPDSPAVFASLQREESLKQEYDNMVHMDDVNEASILYNLKFRYKEDRFMTNVGNILVSLNPFKDLEYLYTLDVVFQYHKWKLGDLELPPHVYQIADRAYKGLLSDRKPQAIIISGESGAGKTVATKKCLQYFAEVAGSGTGMAEKILAANPILEAFGNAKTVRNNNSSRFGKWIEIYFNELNFQISGAQITSYLLEKPRLVRQGNTERNYHIFYQLFTDSEWRHSLKLGGVDDYHLLNQSGCLRVPGINDAEEFEHVIYALDQCSFTKEEQNAMFEVVGAILHLGNIEFENDVGGTGFALVSGTDQSMVSLIRAANLLQVDEKALSKNLLVKELEIRGDTTAKALDATAASALRDSLIKGLYGLMFSWLVDKINFSIKTADGAEVISAGVLDIFGFEIFEFNSFEQLCINFANEKLQQHFNRSTFKDEQQLYKDEGLDLPVIAFEDNQDLIETVEGRDKKQPGLLVMLDEELNLVGAGSDQNFLKKTAKLHVANPRIRLKGRGRKDSGLKDTEFFIKHYAGEVKYDVIGFLDKNKDELVSNLQKVMKTSKSNFVRDVLFKPSKEPASTGGRRSSKSKKISQGRQFRKQLNSLMSTLDCAAPHYIRCIKPNQTKRANTFEAITTLEQLRYSGLFEAVHIRKQGYPFRLPHPYFFQRYFFLLPRQQGIAQPTSKENCEHLIAYLSEEYVSIEKCRIGKSMVFYRPEQHVLLELLREKFVEKARRVLQRCGRGLLSRVYCKKAREALHSLKRGIAQDDHKKLKSVMTRVRSQEFGWLNLFKEAEVRLRYLRNVAKVKAAMKNLANLDPVYNFDEMKDVLDTADELKLNTPELRKARERLEDVRVLIETKRSLQLGIRDMDKDVLSAALVSVAEIQASKPDFCVEEAAEAKKIIKEIQEEEKLHKKLYESLQTGGLSLSDERINIATIRTENLQSAVSEIKRKAIRSSKGVILLKTSELILKLRKLIVMSAWDDVESSLQDVDIEDGSSVAEAALLELSIISDELKNRKANEILERLLNSSQICGSIGKLVTENCDVKEMEQYFSVVEDLGNLKSDTKATREIAKIFYSIRCAVISHEWAQLENLQLSTNQQESLSSASKDEYTLVQSEYTNRKIIAALSPALNDGRVAGDVGNIDVSKVTTTAITSALALINPSILLTDTTQKLVYTGKALKSIREAAKKQNWDAVELMINAYSEDKGMYSAIAENELELICDETVDRKVKKILKRGLSTGKISGTVGNVKYEEIDDRTLKSAITSALDLGCKSKGSLHLLSNCQKICTLRRHFIKQTWKDAIEFSRTIQGDGHDHLDLSAEIKLAKDECQDRYILKILKIALSSGQLSGDIGNGMYDLVDVKVIEDAVREANEVGTNSQASSKRKNCAEFILMLRRALKDKNWGKLEIALKNMTNYSVESVCTAEIERAKDEHANWKIISLCSKAVELGRVSGSIEAPNLEACSVQEMDTAVANVEMLGHKTQEASSWLYTCKALSNLRSLLVVNDFTALEHEINSVDKSMLPKPVLQEIELIIGISHNELILKKLKHSLSLGAISGDVGTIREEGIQYVDLEAAIGWVEELGTRTRVASAALSLAKDALISRKALKTCQLEELKVLTARHESILDDSFKMSISEIDLARRECLDRTTQAKLKAAFSSGQISESNGLPIVDGIIVHDLFEIVKFARQKNLENPKTIQMVSAGEVVQDIRRSVKNSDFESLKLGLQKFEEEVFLIPAIEKELLVAKDIYNNFVIITTLKDAVSTGMAAGEIGNINLGLIELGKLDDALALVEKLTCKTQDAKQLLQSANVVRRIRFALKFMDWDSLEKIMNEVKHLTVVKEVKPEIQLAQNEINNRLVINRLKSVMIDGRVIGDVGYLNQSNIALDDITVALEMAERLGCKTMEARLLRDTASTAYRFREALVNEKWDHLEQQLSRLDRDGVSDIVVGEIDLLAKECDNRNAILEMAGALAVGAISGEPGEIDMDRIDVDVVKQSIGRAREYGCHTEEATNMLRTVEFIMTLRTYVQNREWNSVYDHIHENVYEGSLEPVPMAVEEIELAYRQSIDVSVGEHLTNAMVRGRLVFSNGDFNLAKVAIKTLNSAIEYGEGSGFLSKNTNSLLASGRILLSLRTAIIDENSTLLNRILEQEGKDKLHKCAHGEIQSIRDYSTNAQFTKSIKQALRDTRVEGTPGDLVFPPSFEALQAVVDEITAHSGILTIGNQVWFEWGKFMCAIRSLGSMAQWKKVEDIIDNNRPEKVRQEFMEEVSLIRQEAKNRAVVVMLSDALTQDMAVGTIDSIDVSTVSTTHLVTSIEEASAHENLTSAAKLLLASAEYILSLRCALLEGPDWDKIRGVMVKLNAGSIANIVDDEINFVAKAAENQLVVRILTDAINNGAIDGPASSDTFEGVDFHVIDEALSLADKFSCDTTTSKDLILVATLIRRLRAAVAEGFWDSAEKTVGEAKDIQELFPLNVWAEVELASNIAKHRKTMACLAEGVSKGAAKGNVGKINYSEVHTEAIEKALSRVYEIRSVTEESKQMIAAIETLRMLRIHMKAREWPRLQHTLQGAYEAGQYRLIPEELQVIRDECENALMCAQLLEAMADGVPIGTIGNVDFEQIDLEEVLSAVSNAEKIVPKTEEAKLLLQTARIVQNTRELMCNGEFQDIHDILQGVGAEDVDSVAVDEIDRYRQEADNFLIIRDLHDAMLSGKAVRTQDKLDVSTVRTKQLENVLDRARKTTLHSEEAKTYFRTAEVLFDMRVALKNEDWHTIEKSLNVCRTSHLSDAAQSEINAVQDMKDDRTVVLELTEAISAGYATGNIGDRDTSTIDLVTLDTAIAHALKLGCRTREAKRILQNARLVRQIRLAWRVYEHDGVSDLRSVLEQIEELEGFAPLPVAEKEFQATVDEVNNYDICRKLEHAIENGKVRGEVGQINTSDISTDALVLAIAEGARLKCKTEKAQVLQNCAKVLRGVRGDVLHDDWLSVEARLLSVDPNDTVTIAPSAKAEIGLLKLEIDDRKVSRALDAALDPSTSCIEGLQEAILLAEEIGSKSISSGRLLNSAKFILNLRKHVADKNWSSVGQSLTGVSVHLLPEKTQPEVLQIRNELLEITAKEKLTNALSSGGLSGDLITASVSTVHLDDLDAAIRYVRAMTCDSLEILSLEKTAVAVRRLRKAILDRDFDSQQKALDAVGVSCVGTANAKFIEEEIKITRELAENRQNTEKLRDALRVGGGDGEPGALDTSNVEVEMLRSSIKCAHELQRCTVELKNVCSVAEKILALRDALLFGKWEIITEFSIRVKACGALTDEEKDYLGVDDAEIVESEINAIISELSIRDAVRDLRQALVLGRPTFEGAHVNVSTITTSGLEVALERGQKAGVRAGEGHQLMITAKYLIQLRKALMDGNWADVISTMEQIDEVEASPFAADEIESVRVYAQWHTDVRDVTLGLIGAMSTKDIAKLTYLVEQADFLRLDSLADMDIASVVIHSKALLVKLQKSHDDLSSSLSTNHLRMRFALEQATKLGYETSSIAQKVAERLADCDALREKSETAVMKLDVILMQQVLKQAAGYGVSLRLAARMKEILSLPFPQLLQLKLRLAVESEDVDAIADITIQIKALHFREFRTTDHYSLYNFQNLKDGQPEDFLTFSPLPINGSLTRLDDRENIVSIRMFKHVMGFMGDRHYTYPMTLAAEALQTAYFHPVLRDELFLQIIKQITNNPSGESVEKGWLLLYITLSVFPPSSNLENYLEHFLRTNQRAGSVLKQLHVIVYQGCASTPPKPQDIELWVSQQSASGFRSTSESLKYM
jgi:myosin heavy subunit